VLGSHLELMTRFFFFVWQFWVSWCWAPSLARGWVCNLLLQLLLGLARAVTFRSKSCRTHGRILLSHFKLPQPGGPGPHIFIPQEQDGPVIPLGTGFPFCRLLWLAGIQWRYSNPPPHGYSSKLKVLSYFTTDGRSVSQYILVSSPFWDLRPDITSCRNVAVLSLWGVLSDERSGLSLVSHCQQ
jgi:hypothetical protein